MGACCGCCRRQGHDRHDGGVGLRSDAPISGYNPQIFVALNDYVAGSPAEVNLKKGDRVQLLSMETNNFVFVRAAKTHGTRGYVPVEYLAPIDTTEAEDFFYGSIRGKDANAVLMDATLPAGSYLIRASEGQRSNDDYDEVGGEETQTPYALSMKDDKNPPRIHHYRITITDLEECYIKPERRFPSIRALLAFYQSNPEGFPCKLTQCVPRPTPVKRELPLEMRESWREIPRNQLKMMKMLGEGRFGAVHKAIWTQPDGTKLTVVAKQLKQVITLPDKQTLLNEASTMKGLRHENVIRLYGVVSSSEPYYIITEFVKDGSLEDYLRARTKHHKPDLPATALVDICWQICKGMAYLASKRLVHRDVAARNVLIDVTSETPYSCVIKVADFGLARTLNKQYVYKMRHETYIATRWLAPEAFDKSVFSVESDVWAFGVTMAEIYRNGRDPWNDMSDQKQEHLMKEGRAPPQPPSMPAPVNDIMVRCCQLDPTSRPKFKDLVTEFEELLNSMIGKSTRAMPGSSKLSNSSMKSMKSVKSMK